MRARYTSEVNPLLPQFAKSVPMTNEDMGALLIRTDKIFAGLALHQFRTEGAIGGKAWPALSPAYAKQKALTHPGKKIMERTGALKRSLTNRGNPGHVKQFKRKPPPATITLGTRQFIAAFHIPGALKNRRLPDRDTLQHTPHQERKYYRAIADYIVTVKFPRMVDKLRKWRKSHPRKPA